jgi:optic atrophy 3 protein
MIHQLNMRLSVATMRDLEAERKAKEKAETPTVKTKEQAEKELQKEEALRAKYGTTPKEAHPTREVPQSVWKRKFRPLPEAKAVDLFADVIGDAFILLVAGALIIYEYYRSSQKPDHNLEKIKELNQQLEELKLIEEERLEEEKRRERRIEAMETALRHYKDPKTKQPLLPTPMPIPAPST